MGTVEEKKEKLKSHAFALESQFTRRVWKMGRCNILLLLLVLHSSSSPQWGTANAEVKVPSAENPALSKVFSFKPGLDQNIVLHASPAARNLSLIHI